MGYYRDQTLALATGIVDTKQFFAQLYAHADAEHDPCSGGRQMINHFATRYYKQGKFIDQTTMINCAAFVSSTSSQLPKALGLGYASKLFKKIHNQEFYLSSSACQSKDAFNISNFSKNGQEVVFASIGNASCAEGLFWETVNAITVEQIPIVLSVWDDEYGISVPNSIQLAKSDLSSILSGFKNSSGLNGIKLFTVKGHNYLELMSTYKKATIHARKYHNPCIIHVTELTQPLGHSTSGSATRYKPNKRIQWEKENDCLVRFKDFIIKNYHQKDFDITDRIKNLEEKINHQTKIYRDQAFLAFQKDQKSFGLKLINITKKVLTQLTTSDNDQTFCLSPNIKKFKKLCLEIDKKATNHPLRNDQDSLLGYDFKVDTTNNIDMLSNIHNSIRSMLFLIKSDENLQKIISKSSLAELIALNKKCVTYGYDRYQTDLFIEDYANSTFSIKSYEPSYKSDKISSYQIISNYFDEKLNSDPRVVILGEDVGVLGGVNKEFQGLYKKYGKYRMIDTGIREATILGQGMGLAMRGFRPVIDIQYLDYLIFCLQGLSDELSCLHYRTAGGQISPCIIRTKGHRLMGIWHSGSPMSMLLGSIRGIHLAVPRDSLVACRMYETFFQGNDPGLVIEPMNGYRKKLTQPKSLLGCTLALGKVEILTAGGDITVVSYGSTLFEVLKANKMLQSNFKIHLEVIDIQYLMPFDLEHEIAKSVSKTKRLLIVDEDLPAGASGYILNIILEQQKVFDKLLTAPRTLTASENRCSYGIDGDYYCKPQCHDIVSYCLNMISNS